MTDDDARLVAGRYELLERIAAGGMGAVWAARDVETGREVALKEMHVPAHLVLAADPDPDPDPGTGTDADTGARSAAVERMRREARAAGRVDHPSVVTIHDVVVHGRRPWIVMELVRGETLADLLDREGALPEREAARIALPVLEGLRAAHERGVLHRDVKPANVLLGRDGRVVLTDFGIARIEGETSLTVSGEFFGSLRYCAPERMGGRRPGPESDLWSFGVLLYEAVEGWSPFRRETMEATVAAVLSGAAVPPARAERLGPLVGCLLAQDPGERPEADAVLTVLREVAGEGADGDDAADVQPEPDPQPDPQPEPEPEFIGPELDVSALAEPEADPEPEPAHSATATTVRATPDSHSPREPKAEAAVEAEAETARTARGPRKRTVVAVSGAVLAAALAGWLVLRAFDGGTGTGDGPPLAGGSASPGADPSGSAAPDWGKDTRTYEEDRFGYRIAVPDHFVREPGADRVVYEDPDDDQVWVEVYRDQDGPSASPRDWAEREIEWLAKGAPEDGRRTVRTRSGALSGTEHGGEEAARYTVRLQSLDRAGEASKLVVQRNLVVPDGDGGMYQLRVSVPDADDAETDGKGLFDAAVTGFG
ncbi:serine/threonine-protein kinase [Streptomyces daliensis]